MQVYKPAQPVVVFTLLALLFLSLVGLTVFVHEVWWTAGDPGPERWLYVLWLAVLALLWWTWLRLPLEIRVIKDHTLEFRGILRRTVLAPGDLIGLKASLAPGLVILKYKQGSLRLFSRMPEFGELLATLTALNPDMTLRGVADR